MSENQPQGLRRATSPRAPRRNHTHVRGDHRTATAVYSERDGEVVSAAPATHWPAWTDEIRVTLASGIGG